MPRHRTLKSLFLDIVVFVGMFALFGHLSINFWERFIIQTELTSMKTSLHSLKETINRIGFAYDNLHRELIGLTEITDNKAPNKQPINKQATVQAKNHTTLTRPLHFDKTVQNIGQTLKQNKTTQNIVQEKKNKCRNKNTSTITRYPTESTGVGLGSERCYYDCPNEEYCKYRSCANIHRCCKEYECYNPIDNWKF